MSTRVFGIQFNRSLIEGNGIGKFTLTRKKVTKLIIGKGLIRAELYDKLIFRFSIEKLLHYLRDDSFIVILLQYLEVKSQLILLMRVK